MKNKKIIIASLLFLAVVTIVFLLISGNLNKKDKSSVVDGETKEKEINNEISNSLYSSITDVNCEKTLVFDFEENEELLVKDFSLEQKLNLVFRSLELDDKLDNELTKKDFNNYAKKVFGKSFNKELSINKFKYKDKVWTEKENSINSETVEKCNESNIVVKNFSYSPTEIGIELGITRDGKLYNMDNDLIGSYKKTEELNVLLDSSTAYYYIYEFDGETPYLTKVKPILKVKLEK